MQIRHFTEAFHTGIAALDSVMHTREPRCYRLVATGTIPNMLLWVRADCESCVNSPVAPIF
jgi:hypothetical protein